MGINSISFGPPRVRCTHIGRTCGEPDEIKENTNPKIITAPFRNQGFFTFEVLYVFFFIMLSHAFLSKVGQVTR